MDSFSRSSKRTRQACEPCRRKKTRCPGERPTCSYCLRLGHGCDYDEPDVAETGPSKKARKMEDRMDSLETKLDSLFDHLRSPSFSQSLAQKSPSNVSRVGVSEDAFENTSSAGHHRARRHYDVDFEETLRRFMVYCHNQPVALLRGGTSKRPVDSALRPAVEALSMRFPPRNFGALDRELVRLKTRKCRDIVMQSIEDHQVELSTLQSLCLLSIIDFTEGKTIQARLDLAIASELCWSRQEAPSCQELEGFDDCAQSILMLQCLQGKDFNLAGSSKSWNVTSSASGEIDMQTTTRMLAEIWQRGQLYAACHIDKDDPPPWHSQSDYMTLYLKHMELDGCVPLQHRLLGSKLLDQSSDELHARRAYFGPRIFLQFTYAGIACLINHPFLLSLRLRNCRHTVPRSFLRQSFEQLSRNAGWMIYFIDLLQEKNFLPSDPFLAHHVIVVATIHLQHSFVDDELLRGKAKTGLDKCIRFLEQLGRLWPNVAIMVENLRRLQTSVTSSNRNSTSVNKSPSWKIDSHLLWNLLIHARAGQVGAVVDQSIFGPALSNATASRQSTVADFDLVGSVGITGHPAASSDPNPEYAPQSFQEPVQEFSARGITTGAEHVEQEAYPVEGPIEDQLWNATVNLEPEIDSLSWQVHDFGKAIDDWFNVALPDRPS